MCKGENTSGSTVKLKIYEYTYYSVEAYALSTKLASSHGTFPVMVYCKS